MIHSFVFATIFTLEACESDSVCAVYTEKWKSEALSWRWYSSKLFPGRHDTISDRKQTVELIFDRNTLSFVFIQYPLLECVGIKFRSGHVLMAEHVIWQ